VKPTLLSHTIVGVWATPMPGVPQMDPNILKNLFDAPYTTQVGIAQDGSLLIQQMAKPPAPTLLFGQQRFQVQTPTLEGAVSAFGRFRQLAYTSANQQVPLVAHLGINIEIEWTDKKFKAPTPASWLSAVYIRKGLFKPPLEAEVEVVTLNFVLKLADPARTYNITLQPRSNNAEGIFALVNDHREWLKAMPQADEVAALMHETVDDIDMRLTPLILGGVAEHA
jgi:hypothetical protein